LLRWQNVGWCDIIALLIASQIIQQQEGLYKNKNKPSRLFGFSQYGEQYGESGLGGSTVFSYNKTIETFKTSTAV